MNRERLLPGGTHRAGFLPGLGTHVGASRKKKAVSWEGTAKPSGREWARQGGHAFLPSLPLPVFPGRHFGSS